MMAQRKEIIDMLKRSLKQKGLTYADIARQLQLSEISVKRNFSQKNFTLDRLESICNMVNVDFSDLVQMADDEKEKISALTLEQEQELLADLKFLLVAICVQNAWEMEEIIQNYDVTESQCIAYLIRLERHGLIRLLPNNRFRRMLAHDFRWQPQGPLETFLETTVQNEFMNSHFTDSGETRIYMTGMLSRHSLDVLNKKLEALAREFALLQQDDSRLPAESRYNSGMMLAIRPWELSVFEALQR
ncbi:MAG: helix-turn-helix domain-containing protein [Gammaproteobacteria bacterium]|jgi:DNA-binding Xre family transcriptional regulator